MSSVAQVRPPSVRPVAISARRLSKAFGSRRVLVDLDLHVPAGQFVAVVGRSGCGKSTLLRVLTGLDRPDSGILRVGDNDTAVNARLMFQESRLLPWASVIQNVAVGLDAKEDERAVREKALAVLEEVGLADRAEAWPSTLSGGQKQRVALARALACQPAFLAFDEPLGALDALTRIEMQHLIGRVFDREGFTAVLVTHDVSEAVALADRIVVLDHGVIALDVPVALPRGYRRGTPDAAALENRILSQLLHKAAA